ncbi:unnamed protein product [Rhizoctonia solani]|uniref:Dihydrolipoamide acetyltransferase component of pyruvate dehydrogenase complex n=1 Tax=Rhizoctonia solani TaxID=456999 RepID=A0A8H2Y236_9AGAM|nr:unnamed protein product [Rhizoctonia solani]
MASNDLTVPTSPPALKDSRASLDDPQPNAFVRGYQSVFQSLGFKKGYNFVLWFIFGGAMLGFVLAFMYLHAPTMLAGIAPGEAYWFRRGIYKAGILIHLGSILPAGFLAVFQFVPIIRYKVILVHRISGYISIFLLFIGMASAFAITRRSFGGEMSSQTWTMTIGALVLVMATLGWANIKRLQIDQHRKWMLRTWFYASPIITARIIMIISANIISAIGQYYALWSCDEVLYTLDNDMTRLMEEFPACSTGALESVHVAVPAVWTQAVNIGSTFRLTFGPSLWIASLVHAIGVEIYIHLTPGETARLRKVSYQKQLERGMSAALLAKRKALKTFHLADIGEGITECEVLKWSIKPQSPVGSFDPLCEVQSDKATVEITSPFDGVVKELLVQEGHIAKVGEGLCVIEVEEDSDSASSSDEPAQPQAPATSTPTPTPQTTSAIEGSYTPPPARRHHPMDPARPAESLSAATGQRAGKQDAFEKGGNQALATPSIRHYARSQGISDLDVLMPGTGRGGRIERADIDAYLKRSQKSETSSAASTKRDLGEEMVIEMGRTRWGMWKSMTKSLEIPLFGYSATLDLTALNEMLPTLNAHIPQEYRPPPPAPEHAPSISPDSIFSGSPEAKQSLVASSDPATHFKRMTMLPLLLKTLSLAMMEWPVMRTHINPTAEPSTKPTLTIRPSADISIGLSTPTGLYTPTLVGLNNHSPYAIAGSLARLAYLGRQTPSGLTPADMPKRGGTLTVSNVGAIGAGKWAVPRLVQGGGVAIVAVGRAEWVVKPSGEKRLEVGVSWSADHRIVEGAELAAFVESWRSWVENPARLVGIGQ